MKRLPLYLLLILSITLCICSATLAVYTSGTDLTASEISAKRFYVGVGGNQANFDLTLSPGGKQTHEFTVSNQNSAGDVAEVDIGLDFAGDYANALAAMPGLKINLYEDSNLLTSADASGQLAYHISRAFTANVASARSFRLEFAWDYSGNYQNLLKSGSKISGISLYITGTQEKSAATNN